MVKFILFLLTLFLPCSIGIRILIFCPAFGISHLAFNARLANVLHSQGHEVVIVNQYFTKGLRLDAEMAPNAVVVNLESEPVPSLIQAFGAMQDSIFTGMTPFRMVHLLSQFMLQFSKNCEDIMELIEKGEVRNLIGKDFDLALLHPYDNCPLAASRLLGVTKFGWVTPGTYILDNAASWINLHRVPSYVPAAMTGLSHHMSFTQKLENIFIGFYTAFQGGLPPWDVYSHEDALAKKVSSKMGHPFSIRDLFQNISLFLINGESVLNFPRPLPHGITSLGDLGGATPSATTFSPEPELESPFREIVDRSKGIIIFSFGSIANTTKMPLFMKEAFLEGFRNLSEYEVLWKMDVGLEGVGSLPHVHLFSWLPQRDLLRHPKARLFITHGGYNSLVEATEAGVPLVLIPLFGDQLGNAARAERHGIGLVLSEKSKVTPESFGSLLQTVINDPEFKRNAKKLSLFMKDKILASKTDLEYRIRALHRADQPRTIALALHLNFCQYFCLDATLLLLSTAFFFSKIIVS